MNNSREKIDFAVLKLSQDGVLLELFRRWWHDKQECSTEAEGGDEFLNLVSTKYSKTCRVLVVNGNFVKCQ